MIEEEEEVANFYNVTACCERVQLAGVCMPLCSFDAKMSDLRTLAPLCAQEFHKLLRCGAGGKTQCHYKVIIYTRLFILLSDLV